MSNNIIKQDNITIMEEKNGEWLGILIIYGQKDKYTIKCGGIVLWDGEIQYYVPKLDVPIYYMEKSPLYILNDMVNHIGL